MGVNLLLSYAFFAKDDLRSYRANLPCGRLLIDSGAFTAASVGKVIKLDEYAEFLTTWRGTYDHAVTLDVIGDPVATRRNTLRLHAKGLPVLPVFTRGGTVADFDAMVKDSGYVCVGGGVGMHKTVYQKRLRALQVRAEQLGGGIHALGVGNLNSLRKIRPYSADTSNISSVFRYGTVIAYDGRELQRVVVADKADLRANVRTFRDQGVSITDLVRTGRHPVGEARDVLVRGLGVALAAADEDTMRFRVPVPHSVTDSPGTHFYSALTGAHLARPAAQLDRLLHDGTMAPPMWQRRAHQHAVHCRAAA